MLVRPSPGTPSGALHLSPRLQAAAELVPDCSAVYDIGTDHAWLPIWLVRQDRCRRAVAADLRHGPLSRAAAHIRHYGLADRIETCLTDGLNGLKPQAGDVVILAGLGGHEIMRILAGVGRPAPILVIQAQKSLPELRHWLFNQGWLIDREILACETKRFYPVLRACFTGRSRRLTDLEAWVGPDILAHPPDNLPLYLDQLCCRLQKQTRGLPQLFSLLEEIKGLIPSTGGSPAKQARETGLPNLVSPEKDGRTCLDNNPNK